MSLALVYAALLAPAPIAAAPPLLPPLGCEVELLDGSRAELLTWRQVGGVRLYTIGRADGAILAGVPAAAIAAVVGRAGTKRTYRPPDAARDPAG